MLEADRALAREETRLVEEAWNEVRRQAFADPLYFGAEILGYDLLRTPAPFHVEIASQMQASAGVEVPAELRNDVVGEGRDWLLIAPRGHIKTTLVDIVGTIWHLLHRPDDRVLIASATWDTAKAVLREIVAHFRENEVFRKFFPEFCPAVKSEFGNTEQFDLPSTVKTRFRKEASIETTGIDRVVTGRHYDVIKATDLVVRENVPPAASPEQMERVKEWFRTTTALLDQTNPRAHRTLDGTFWNDADLYTEVRSKYTRIRKMIYGISDGADGKPVSIWPNCRGNPFSTEKLEQIREETGAFLWAANYKSDPMPLSSAGFRKEYFAIYNEAPKEPMTIAITCDLAISEKDTACHTAIVVTGITHGSRDLYVLALRFGNFTPYQTVEHLYALDEQWQPTYVGIETVAWQKAMIYILNEEARRRGRQLPVRGLMPDARKERRIYTLIAHAERSRIYVRPEHDPLVEQAMRFPVGTRNDIVDALAYRMQDMYAPEIRAITAEIRDVRMTGDRLLEMCEANNAKRSLPWEIDAVEA